MIPVSMLLAAPDPVAPKFGAADVPLAIFNLSTAYGSVKAALRGASAIWADTLEIHGLMTVTIARDSSRCCPFSETPSTPAPCTGRRRQFAAGSVLTRPIAGR